MRWQGNAWGRAAYRAAWAVAGVARAIGYAFRRPLPLPQKRFEYQRHAILHRFREGERVLDIGSGNDPFPHATLLADRFLEPTHHRSDPFVRSGAPIVICDIEALPFRDATFAYVVCSHVLEHVEQPIAACRELQRVAMAGFIETPTLLKDALFSWAKGMHRWYVLRAGTRLIFVEYDDRTAEGIRSDSWQRVISDPVFHPLQEAFARNQDLFNVLFEWDAPFDVTVVDRSGAITSSR